MTAPLRPLALLSFLVACQAPASTTDVHTPSPTTPAPTDATGATGDTGTAPTTASIQLLDAGTPLADIAVSVHHSDGTVREVLTSDSDGLVRIDDVPEEGVGVTVPRSVLEGLPGLVTVFGVTPGADLTWGSHAAMPSIEVDYVMPETDIDANSLVMMAGCTTHTPGAESGRFFVAPECLEDGVLDVTLVARDNMGHAIAFVLAQDVAVDNDAAFLDLDGADWRTDFSDVAYNVVNGDREGALLVRAFHPSMRTTLIQHQTFEVTTPGAASAHAIPTLPGMNDTLDSIVSIGAANGAGESVNVQLARSDDTSAGVLTTDVSGLPDWMEGLSITPDRKTIAVSSPGTFRCGTSSAPVHAVATVRGSANDRFYTWQVLFEGGEGSVYAMPELAPELVDHWPEEELDQLRVEVLRGSTPTGDYGALLDAQHPVHAMRFPTPEPGEQSCLVTVHGAGEV